MPGAESTHSRVEPGCYDQGPPREPGGKGTVTGGTEKPRLCHLPKVGRLLRSAGAQWEEQERMAEKGLNVIKSTKPGCHGPALSLAESFPRAELRSRPDLSRPWLPRYKVRGIHASHEGNSMRREGKVLSGQCQPQQPRLSLTPLLLTGASTLGRCRTRVGPGVWILKSPRVRPRCRRGGSSCVLAWWTCRGVPRLSLLSIPELLTTYHTQTDRACSTLPAST